MFEYFSEDPDMESVMLDSSVIRAHAQVRHIVPASEMLTYVPQAQPIKKGAA